VREAEEGDRCLHLSLVSMTSIKAVDFFFVNCRTLLRELPTLLCVFFSLLFYFLLSPLSLSVQPWTSRLALLALFFFFLFILCLSLHRTSPKKKNPITPQKK
jgi:hypothetical protein